MCPINCVCIPPFACFFVLLLLKSCCKYGIFVFGVPFYLQFLAGCHHGGLHVGKLCILVTVFATCMLMFVIVISHHTSPIFSICSSEPACSHPPPFLPPICVFLPRSTFLICSHSHRSTAIGCHCIFDIYFNIMLIIRSCICALAPPHS